MKRLNRRSFLAASAASAAMTAVPAFGAPGAPNAPGRGDQEIPLPACRHPRVRCRGRGDRWCRGCRHRGGAPPRRAGRRFALVEAGPAVGGRCITDTALFGVPFDRGAHWVQHAGHQSGGQARDQTGLDLYPAPPGQRVRIGRRYAREGEMEDYLGGTVRATTAIADASRKTDLACAQALPKDLGAWRPTIEFVLGPFGSPRI